MLFKCRPFEGFQHFTNTVSHVSLPWSIKDKSGSVCVSANMHIYEQHISVMFYTYMITNILWTIHHWCINFFVTHVCMGSNLVQCTDQVIHGLFLSSYSWDSSITDSNTADNGVDRDQLIQRDNSCTTLGFCSRKEVQTIQGTFKEEYCRRYKHAIPQLGKPGLDDWLRNSYATRAILSMANKAE